MLNSFNLNVSEANGDMVKLSKLVGSGMVGEDKLDAEITRLTRYVDRVTPIMELGPDSFEDASFSMKKDIEDTTVMIKAMQTMKLNLKGIK